MQVWLQEFAWTEADKPVKLAARSAMVPDNPKLAKQPIFCFETMMNLLYWSCYVYDHKMVRQLHPFLLLQQCSLCLDLDKSDGSCVCIISQSSGLQAQMLGSYHTVYLLHALSYLSSPCDDASLCRSRPTSQPPKQAGLQLSSKRSTAHRRSLKAHPSPQAPL